jgi:hypothetical protein
MRDLQSLKEELEERIEINENLYNFGEIEK